MDDEPRDPFAAAAARRRTLAGKTIGDDLSALDPDLDTVPDTLVTLDGRKLTITGRDPLTGRENRADGIIVVVPALFADPARADDDDAT